MSRAQSWAAGLASGIVASSSLVASVSAWWATLPQEVRGFAGALFGGLALELIAVLRVWVRRRAARALGVPDPGPTAEQPQEQPQEPTGEPTAEQPQEQPQEPSE